MESKVLIIILNYNGAEYIRDCFFSLQNINYPRDLFKILVIDNASTDNSVEMIEKSWPDINIIKNEKNFGFTVGNNVGFKYAVDNNFDYVYLLNQDTAVEADFLIEAVKLAETDQSIGAVQSKLLLFQSKKINSIGNEIHFLGFGYAGGYQMPDKEMAVKEITYPSGAAVLVSVKALKEVGFFNEEFFAYHEDTDLGWRLWLCGYKVLLAPNSVVYHKYEFSRSIKKYYYMERNRYLIMLQNYKMATIFLLLPALTAMDIAMFFYSFLGGFWKEEFKVYGYFFKQKSWDNILKSRQDISAKRKIKDREIIKRFTGKIEFQEVQNPLLKYIANPIFNLYWQIVKRLIWW